MFLNTRGLQYALKFLYYWMLIINTNNNFLIDINNITKFCDERPERKIIKINGNHYINDD